MLQTLPIPKSDLISFISFRFWHLSTLSEKLQLKENDGLVFFALEPSFSKTKGFPILNRDWAKQRIQLDHIGVRNPKETVAILATKEKKQFVCCLQWEKKNTLAQMIHGEISDVLGWFFSIIPLLAFRVPVRGDGRQPEICVLPW